MENKKIKGWEEWSEKETASLYENYDKCTIAELCTRVGREENSVRAKMHVMNLVRPKRLSAVFGVNKWSDEEKEFLRENHCKMTAVDIADHLCKGLNSVYRISHQLNLGGIFNQDNAKVFQKVWTKEQEQILKDNYGQMKTKDIAELLQKSTKIIYSKVASMRQRKDEVEDLRCRGQALFAPDKNVIAERLKRKQDLDELIKPEPEIVFESELDKMLYHIERSQNKIDYKPNNNKEQ